MIAKRVPSPKQASSIQRLVSYIADPAKQINIQPTGQQEGISQLVSYMDKSQAVIRITNCGFDTIPTAIWEIQATQKKNTRSKKNKNYHLVISFREGEQPSKDILEAIEDKIVERIGFSGHQRISALHTDTNNWHLHVAINKVHPVTFCNVEPFYDKFKMSEACRELEKEFGLLPDNGIQKNRKKPMNPAQDKEAHTGTQSLVSWIREKAVSEIKEVLAKDDLKWAELHKTLNKYGLTIRPRGAGFVIQDINSGLTVKASSVDREFSKKKIENRIGVYQDAKITYTIKEQYKEKPIQPPSLERDRIWKKYKEEQNKNRFERREQLKIIKDQRKKYLQKIFADIRGRKRLIQEKTWLSWRHKKEVYAALQVEKLKALETAAIIYQQRRDLVNVRWPVLTWTAFLQREAEKGNNMAIKLLRQGKGKSIHSKANFISQSSDNVSIYQDIKYRVDKRGRITYQLPDGWVLDAGQCIQPGSMNHNVLVATLQIAAGKYGKKLRVNGSSEFVNAIKKAAYDRRLNITINGKDIKVKQQSRSKGNVER